MAEARHRLTALMTSRRDDWETPWELYSRLHDRHAFTLDPCATPQNAKCHRYYTKDEDGLRQPWNPERVFLNPPYGPGVRDWLNKAWSEATYVVALLPARTDTRWWHECVEHRASEIEFLQGRVHFVGAQSGAPFPSVVVTYEPGVRRRRGRRLLVRSEL